MYSVLRVVLPLLVVCLWVLPFPADEKPEPKSEPLPFNTHIETYRAADGLMVFSLKLEQPFLAEEFDKSNYLRVRPLDGNAFLIYPPETRFQQKHAEFLGRLRGTGKTKLRVTYEMVSENLDGSKKIVQHQGDVEITIPTKEGGPRSIYTEWANQQNADFLKLLGYYPNDSFLQYALLQSRARHGAATPELPSPATPPIDLESQLYNTFTGAAAIQQALQRTTLSGGDQPGDQTVHISQLTGPALQSLPYEELLAKKKAASVTPRPQEVTKLVPEDQYCLSFNSPETAATLFDLSADWGDSLLRLFTVTARDNRLQEKLENQLLFRREGLLKLFTEGAIGDVSLTGSDLNVVEGTDFSLLIRLKKPDVFAKAAADWLESARGKYKSLKQTEFNYRGNRILAAYTEDRVVSSFSVRLGDHAVLSNSHRAIRRIVDTYTGAAPKLFDALDYRYVTTLLAPNDDVNSGYFYASEGFLRHMVGPAYKIGEKRRRQAYNHLIMINNASLLYRMENNTSPASLTDLVEGRYLDASKLICPGGGAYSWDAAGDSAASSVYNRLKYLTPLLEVPVLKVSAKEQQQYNRYKADYEAFWAGLFDPIAVRITNGPRVKLETCVLPFANGSQYRFLREMLATRPLRLRTAPIAKTAVLSVLAVTGRQANAAFVKQLPGVADVLDADPTLTDLSFIGDRISFHVCDDDSILEVDPTLLRPLHQIGIQLGVNEQTLASFGLTALKLPTYVTLDIEDRDKVSRLLEKLLARIPLKKSDFFGLPTALDAYRLPDYKNHAVYVLSYQIYALKVRLHLALVGDQLVAATKAKTLRDVIDAAGTPERETPTAHAMFRFNRLALDRMKGDLQLYWEEKNRLAAYENILPIYTLTKLYGVPVGEVNRLAQAKYGVSYICPDGGEYRYDPATDQVVASIFGNRQQPRQNATLSPNSSFARLLDRLEEITATLRFEEAGLIATVEIARVASRRE
jgi:hypothetical protein